MTKNYLPPTDFLRECFSYDPQTGNFLWRSRPESHFDRPAIAKAWNSRMAGAPAFQQTDRDGYRRCEVRYGGRKLSLRAARVAYKLVTGEEPDLVDHENRMRSDDRFDNLRPATPLDSSRNVSGRAGKILPKGVFFEKGRFRASLSLNHQKIHLGGFNSPSEAHAAYCAKASELFGEFFNPGPRRDTIWD